MNVESLLRRYVWGIMCDYVAPEMGVKLKVQLQIEDDIPKQNIDVAPCKVC
jgi:hypothetical protein